MPEVILRKIATVVEEIFHEGGPVSSHPPKRGAIMAVIFNPFAGKYVEDLQPFMEDLKPLGLMMAQRLLAVLGGDAAAIEGYGKATLVGSAGELEHGALWHAPGGYAMREVLGGAKAIVPSAKKVGGMGARLDVPITHVNAAYVRSHFDSMEVGMNDSPRAGELMVVLVMTTGPRVHSRMGGAGGQSDQGRGWAAMSADIRKIAVWVEETYMEAGQVVAPATRKAVAVAVIANPFAGRFVEDLTVLMDIGAELGALLGDRCVAALGILPAQAQSYGKAAMVGELGELEHAAAILHPKLGAPLRVAVGGGAALVPSSKKMGGPGQVLDVPLGHKDAAFVRSHFDAIEVRLNDAPRADEIMVAVAVTDGGRPLARVGGLTHEAAEGRDGLR